MECGFTDSDGWWNICLTMAVPGSLYIGSIVVRICYGVRLAISIPTASELYGLKYYGLIYNILILNLPLGSFLFSGLLAGLLYDAEATRTADGGNTCVEEKKFTNFAVQIGSSDISEVIESYVPVLNVRRLSEKATLSKRMFPHSAAYYLFSARDIMVPARGKAKIATDLSIDLPPGTYGRVASRPGTYDYMQWVYCGVDISVPEDLLSLFSRIWPVIRF